MTTRSALVGGSAATAASVVLGGCADRGLASAPSSSTGAGTWAAVAAAAVLVVVVVAALVALPGRDGRDGARLAEAVLALQAGAVALGTAVVVGAAVRSDQLITREPGAEQASSLLRLTGLDGGDSGFFPIVAVVSVLLGGLLLVITVLATRFAAGRDPLERALACGLLALESVAAATVAVFLVLGERGLPVVLPALALPVLVAAALTARPR